jgi:multicomponent K+:H+ antiporter subunit E
MNRVDGGVSRVLVVVLLGLWLLMNQTLAAGHIVLGGVLAVTLAWFGSKLRPLQGRVPRLGAAARLFPIVLYDVLRSNLRVARVVLGLRRGEIRSGFLRIPLELRDPHALALLASIVTATPGTVWAGLSPDGDALTLHVLELEDEQALIQFVKRRYEQPLMRIFE